MARLRASAMTEAVVSIAASATKTLVQILAPTNQMVALAAAYISFDGITPGDKPCEVQLLLQTSAGTAGVTGAPVLLDAARTCTIQTSSLYGPWATTEPTASTIRKRWYIHPQAGYERIYLPGADEVILKEATRLGLRIITSSTWTTCNALAGIDFEE